VGACIGDSGVDRLESATEPDLVIRSDDQSDRPGLQVVLVLRLGVRQRGPRRDQGLGRDPLRSCDVGAWPASFVLKIDHLLQGVAVLNPSYPETDVELIAVVDQNE
jgi:hypothetical protein